MFGKYEINGWKEAQDIVTSISQSSPKWIFRGQPYADKLLSTSLQRAAESYSISLELLPEIELNMLNDFKRTCHNYLKNIPSNLIDILSILQHHGCTTRLLDFTYSFYIAMYFAIEPSIDHGCVWCINKASLLNKLRETLQEKAISTNNVVNKESLIASVDIYKDGLYNYGRDTALHYVGKKDVDTDFVIPVESYIVNERMAIQQGIFLFPSNILKDFHTNLYTT